MILTPGQFDAEDHVVLCYSVISYIGKHDSLTLDVCEVARTLSLAVDLVPKLVNQPRDEWDGVRWLEHFQSFEEDSLAACLAYHCQPEYEMDLKTIITLWLRRNYL